MRKAKYLTQQSLASKVADTRGWDIVPIWIERFALAVLAAAFFGLVILNLLKMDLIQRTGLGIGIVGFSIFLAQTLQISKTKADSSQEDPKKRPDIQQNSQGANSPNIAGSGNTVIINSTPPSPSFHEKNDAELFNFSFGEHGIITSQAIAWIRKHTYQPFRLGGFAPVTVAMKGDKLFFDFQVWGGEGKPPIEVKNNDFTVRVPTGWDRNSSANALEVVNANGAPVFQMIRKSATDIVVNGIFPTPSGVILAGSGPTITGARPEDLRNFHLKPIFRYPSWKYPGQYAD